MKLSVLAIVVVIAVCQGQAHAEDVQWKVSPQFRQYSYQAYERGDVVIIPLRAVRKPGSDSDHRSSFTYQVDAPDPSATPQEKFLWASMPIDNGHGTFHWLHERLAFDLRTHEVFLLPRRGMNNVSLKVPNGSQFWCEPDALKEETHSIDHYNAGGMHYPDVCPSALIKSAKETKGLRFIGKKQELYGIDLQFVAGLIRELDLAHEVDRFKFARTVEKQLEVVQAVQQQQQTAAELERIRTAPERGQAIIARAEVGERLCMDVQLSRQAAIVAGFLEAVRGNKIQVRVNSVKSPQGGTNWTGDVNIDGIVYTPGNLVWADGKAWRACD
jgi:hypothetical protein